MSVQVNVNSECPAAAGPATKQVRVRFNELDAGQVSGPFSIETAEAFAVAAIARSGVVSVTVEDAV